MKTLDDFKDLRKDVGFHFTPKQNLESILETGLLPKRGDNSTGTLGQSAIPKPYVSYGLEGVLQMYNRLLNIPREGELKDFQDISHIAFIPENIKNNDPNYQLSILEGFEFIRQYMENNIYLMFDAPMSKYEHTLTDVEILQLNERIEGLTDENGVNIFQRVKFINDEIRRLSEDKTPENESKITEYVKERDQLSIGIYEKTKKEVFQKRGALLNGDNALVLDTIDYNDERLCWTNFEKNPHNTHTIIVNKDGNLAGMPIPAESMGAFSVDGVNVANGLQFFEQIYDRTEKTDLTNLQNPRVVDINLLEQFSEYIRLVEQYREEGLLRMRPEQTITDGKKTITYDESFVVDLSDPSKYPGLEEFAQRVQTYYTEGKVKKKEIRQRLKSEQKEMVVKELAKSFAKDPEVALLHDEAGKVFSSLDRSKEITNEENKIQKDD